MPFATTPRASSVAALRDAAPVPYWLDSPAAPEPADPLTGAERADLAVVGGGFTGLWTALLAKEADPGRDVVLLEGGAVGHAASGRNGGFCAASLTHGLANGVDRFPDEIHTLVALGHANLDAIEATVAAYGIDCSFERTGELDIATEPYQVEDLRAAAELGAQHGEPMTLLSGEQARDSLRSPIVVGAARADGVAMLDPARLAWGLRQACRERGVRLHEHSPVTGMQETSHGVRLTVRGGGTVEAARVALGTNAFPPLLRRIRQFVVPVYDYALMTEPLSPAQRESVGWAGREGVGDSGNHFHYLRLTDDDRILFGGYDAIYHRGNGFGPRLEQRPATFELLAEHFFEMFPQLEGVRFTHQWGGAIDTCTRFSAMWGTAMKGRVAYVVGYTGLGVGATRFGAATMLDLLAGADTERTRLEMVRRKPLPFPPEPLRSIGIGLTTSALHRADENEGRRGLWLRALDRVGLGFDS